MSVSMTIVVFMRISPPPFLSERSWRAIAALINNVDES